MLGSKYQGLKGCEVLEEWRKTLLCDGRPAVVKSTDPMSVLGSVSVVKDTKGPILSASLMRSKLRWDLAFGSEQTTNCSCRTFRWERSDVRSSGQRIALVLEAGWILQGSARTRQLMVADILPFADDADRSSGGGGVLP